MTPETSFGAIGDLVLHEQQFEQVLTRHGHEQALGHADTNVFFYVVGFMLESFNLTANLGHALEIAPDNSVDERLQLLGAPIHNVHVFLERPNRRRAENICQHVCH